MKLIHWDPPSSRKAPIHRACKSESIYSDLFEPRSVFAHYDLLDIHNIDNKTSPIIGLFAVQ